MRRVLRFAGAAACWLSVVVGTLALASGLALATQLILTERYRNEDFGLGLTIAAGGLVVAASSGGVLLWRRSIRQRRAESVAAASTARGWSDRRNLVASLVVALIVALLPSAVRVVEFLATPNACDGDPTAWECGWEEPEEILLPYTALGRIHVPKAIEIEVDQFNDAGDDKVDLRLEGNDTTRLNHAYFWDKESSRQPTMARTCFAEAAFDPDEVPVGKAELHDGEYLCMVGSAGSVVLLHLAYDGVHLNVYPAL